MSKMSYLQTFCNVCQSKLRNSKSRMHERMLALSMDKDTKDLLHMDYVNMLRQENEEGGGGCENEKERGGCGRNIIKAESTSSQKCKNFKEEGEEG